MKENCYSNLDRLFTPRVIAVIGASTDLEKIGGRPLAYSLKHGSKARIYPVNPNAGGREVHGFLFYESVEEIEEEIDLALIAVPARLVADAVRQCVSKQIPFGIIFSSGFGEMGEAGKRLEKDMVETAVKGGMRLIGPNCQGVINLKEKVIASFTPALAIDSITSGAIGFVSQSGAFAGSIFNFVQQRGIGLSKWASIGNQADLDVWDCFMNMIDDSYTRVLGGYLEGIKNGCKLMTVAERALDARKPIVLLKGGVSERGAQAALSHTGSIAGSAAVAQAAFAQKGIISVEGIEELFDIATVLADVQKPARDGIGILTTSGAAGVLITDQCEKYGLNLAPLTDETRQKLASVLPDFGSVANPVDLTAQMINQPEIFTKALDIFLEDEKVGLVIIMFTMVTERLADLCAAKMAEVVPKSKKPIVVCWMATSLADRQIEVIRKQNIPVFETPYRCARAVNALVKYNQFLSERDKHKETKELVVLKVSHDAILAATREKASTVGDGRLVLTEVETHDILNAYGIPTPQGGVVNEEREALALAERIRYPVAVKIESPDILHRSDAGAICLGVETPGELQEAYRQVMANARRYNPQARIKGVSIQEMLPGSGVECLLGTISDADFKRAVMFGLGGIFVEVLRDVSMRVVPLSRFDAEEMVREIKGYKLLKGVRGRGEADIEQLIEVILGVSNLFRDYGKWILEFEINPLIVLPKGQGVVAADCLMVLK